VVSVLSKSHDVDTYTREDLDICNAEEYPDHNEKFLSYDYLINCAGSIKPVVDKQSYEKTLIVNSIFPNYLAKLCYQSGSAKMIHITSDCVFSGEKGQYIETDRHDVTDKYGVSKSLGENLEICNIRTSIIGEEQEGNQRSLIEWAKSEKGNKVKGFTNHKWSGVTCLRLAQIIEYMISNNIYWNGIAHIFSESINKFDLLSKINEVYDLDLEIESFETEHPCDRSMSTIWKHQEFYPILHMAKDIGTQLAEMKDWEM
jgi:dTDP-4-dehydrorhamnose reductase